MSLHDSQSLAALPSEPLLATRHVLTRLVARHSRVIAPDPATGLITVRGSDPAILFLGYLYPLSCLPPAPTRPDPRQLCQGLDGEPDAYRLAALLTFNPPSLRSLYQHALDSLIRLDHANRLDPAMSEPLKFERKLWGMHDATWIERYVTPHYDAVREGAYEHWLWRRPGTKRPHATWRSTQNVPVHRLLWHESRPLDLLLPDERLRKDPEVCNDKLYRNCVNPGHFRHALQLTDDRVIPIHKRNTWVRSGETSRKYRWDMKNISYERHPLNDAMVPVLRCPKGHAFPEATQRLMRDMVYEVSPNYRTNPTGTSWCRECIVQLRMERGMDENDHVNRRSRGIAQPNQLTKAQARADAYYREGQRNLREGNYAAIPTEPVAPRQYEEPSEEDYQRALDSVINVSNRTNPT